RFLLALRRPLHPVLLKFLDLRPVGLEVDLRGLLQHAVAQTGFDHFDIGGAEIEYGQAAADRETDGIERLLLLGFRLGRRRGGGNDRGKQYEYARLHDTHEKNPYER